LKAAHYDPNKANADGTLGGWWTYSNGTDTPLRYAPPGLFDPQGNPSQANASFVGPSNPYLIPLGSYPDTTSPFGLLDVAGMTSEWTEEPRVILGTITGRISDGSAWAVYAGTNGVMDNVAAYSGTRDPGSADGSYGFRIASSVPTPSGALFVGITLFFSRRRR
jgi:formylglycine-generating enzyme required for sulfatase activity